MARKLVRVGRENGREWGAETGESGAWNRVRVGRGNDETGEETGVSGMRTRVRVGREKG